MRINTNLAAKSIFTQYTGKNNTASAPAQKFSFSNAKTTGDSSAGLDMFEKIRARTRSGLENTANEQAAISQNKPP